MNNALTSWKTTLAGVLGGMCILLGPKLQGQPGPALTPVNIATAAAVAYLGIAAKDSDKSNAPNPLPTSQSTGNVPK